LAAGKACWTSRHKIYRNGCPSERNMKNRLYLQAAYLALGGFALSLVLNFSYENLARRIPLGFSVPLFFLVVALGVAADAVGIAAARAKEEALLSMASRKVAGAKEAVWFVRNAPRVSSVFNDLMGDVSATLAGGLAVAMVLRFRGPDLYLTSLAVAGASFVSVGGKAMVKPFALKHAETVILLLGKLRRLWLGTRRQ